MYDGKKSEVVMLSGHKSPRFFTWDDYGISSQRYKKLKDICRSRKHNDLVRSVAYMTDPGIAEYIILSVTGNLSYDGIEYAAGLGRIPCGRTDFYGYRRLFYYNLNEQLKMVQNNF